VAPPTKPVSVNPKPVSVSPKAVRVFPELVNLHLKTVGLHFKTVRRVTKAVVISSGQRKTAGNLRCLPCEYYFVNRQP